jgi:hypothetical protein
VRGRWRFAEKFDLPYYRSFGRFLMSWATAPAALGWCPVHSINKSHQPIHRAFFSHIMNAPQTIVGAPVHVFRLVRKFFKHIRAPSQLHADFLCFSESAMARRFLLALIRKLMAVAARERAINAVQLGNPAAARHAI